MCEATDRIGGRSPSASLTLLLPRFLQLDENMRRAHARDAVHSQKFYFRKHMADLDGDGGGAGGSGGEREREHCGCSTVQVRGRGTFKGGGVVVEYAIGSVVTHSTVFIYMHTHDDDDRSLRR